MGVTCSPMDEADDRPSNGVESGRVQQDDLAVSPRSAAVHEASDEDPDLPPVHAPPPPLLPSVTSPPELVVGHACHVTSPVATAAIWTAAGLPAAGRSGGAEFAESGSGGYPSTAEQTRAGGGGSYGEEMTARLPYRDLVYPASYPGDPGDPSPEAWATSAGPYYTRIGGGHMSADLPPDPASHHHPLVMTPCDPTTFQVTDDWLTAQ